MTEVQKEVLKLLLEHAKEVEIDCIRDGLYDEVLKELPDGEDFKVIIDKLQEYIDSI